MPDKVVVMHDAGVYRDIRKLQRKTRTLGLVILLACAFTIVKNVRFEASRSENEGDQGGD